MQEMLQSIGSESVTYWLLQITTIIIIINFSQYKTLECCPHYK